VRDILNIANQNANEDNVYVHDSMMNSSTDIFTQKFYGNNNNCGMNYASASANVNGNGQYKRFVKKNKHENSIS
jgi:hypothetical protein